MSHLNYMWLSEHKHNYNSVNLYKYVWIHPILHCFLLSGWMLLATAVSPLHNPTWGVWLAASGPLACLKLRLPYPNHPCDVTWAARRLESPPDRQFFNNLFRPTARKPRSTACLKAWIPLPIDAGECFHHMSNIQQSGRNLQTLSYDVTSVAFLYDSHMYISLGSSDAIWRWRSWPTLV